MAAHPLDIAALRQQTPASATLLHFNNAGAALSPQVVTDSLLRHLQLEQRIGGYEAAALSAEQSQRFYQAAARLLACEACEIAFFSSATQAWQSLLMALPLQRGDRIVINQSEYAGNYLTLLQQAKLRGLQIDIVSNTNKGQIDLAQLENMLQQPAALLAMAHVPSQSGAIQPVAAVGELARHKQIPYLVDAAQSAGQLPINVDEIGCDMLVTTGRKYLRGPRGSGFAFVRAALIDKLHPPVMDLHGGQWQNRDNARWRDDARRLESWEHAVAIKIALGRAIDYACDLGIDNLARRIQQLASTLRQRLAVVPGVSIHENADMLSGLVTFSIAGDPAIDVQQRLQRQGINTSVIRRANTLLDFEARELGDINRASVHYYNTEAEVNRFCRILAHGPDTP